MPVQHSEAPPSMLHTTAAALRAAPTIWTARVQISTAGLATAPEAPRSTASHVSAQESFSTEEGGVGGSPVSVSLLSVRPPPALPGYIVRDSLYGEEIPHYRRRDIQYHRKKSLTIKAVPCYSSALPPLSQHIYIYIYIYIYTSYMYT